MAYQLDPNSPECSTPVMKQFVRLKAQAPDSILFFRMGDFYELFAEDAVLAAPILGITLTSRDRKSENPMPMAGVPYHSATNYIQKLLNSGRKVSIAEQLTDPSASKGIVERGIVRTFSPAVQFELGDSNQPRFLATLISDSPKQWTLCLLDPATGVMKISRSLTLVQLLAENALTRVKHFLNAGSKTPAELLFFFENSPLTLLEEIPSNWVSDSDTKSFLQKQYDKISLHPLLDSESALKGASLLVQYVLKSQGIERVSHLHEPQALHETDRLILGPQTSAHLDLEDLFTLINRTATSMGSRHLRGLLDAPFKKAETIFEQQNAIRELAEKSLETEQIHASLKEVYDIDRILGRVVTKLAHPRDTYALGVSLKNSFMFEERLARFEAPQLRGLSVRLAAARSELAPLCDRILRTQKSDAPIHTREGGIFEIGTHPDLDRLIKLTTEGERFLIELETREREQTGINSLKVKYNRVFGYFIEISTTNLKNVPSHYQRKQTTVGGERFFTEELKKFEEEILSASSKQMALESSLFSNLVCDLVEKSEALKSLSEVLGELDALIALSFLGQSNTWCFPKIDQGFHFQLQASRHPVVDHALKGQFVPNDFSLSPETARTLVITGPNMGGKSTVMRQMAQIIILGQMGAPVPAASAAWGIFNSVYTRIGAHDAIAKGQSTFMVEMTELAHILNHADSRSFVVLDEIGRGTSTYDGMSVASAALEYLHQKSSARIVFATHYHELTELEARLPMLKNSHMKVLDEKGKLTFLYELAAGRSSKSFGIQVAELAGLPKHVIKQAWQNLKALEETSSSGTGSTAQLSLFMSSGDHFEGGSTASHFDAEASDSSGVIVAEQAALSSEDAAMLSFGIELSAELKDLDLNSLRPIEALNLLAKFQNRLN
jgi:DNA mismatch repair protein MutS